MFKKIIFLNLYFLSLKVAAAEQCQQYFTDYYEPTAALSSLIKLDQNKDRYLGIQDNFESYICPTGGGACASATAFNGLQILRMYKGESPLVASEVLDRAFHDMPVLKEGRVTNRQLIELFQYFNQLYLPQHKLNFKVDIGSLHRKAKDETDVQIVPTVRSSSQLGLEPGQLKILIYSVWSGEKILGRHFVIVKGFSDGVVSVIDPNKPRSVREFKVIAKNSPTAFYLQKLKDQGEYTFIVDSIFSIESGD